MSKRFTWSVHQKAILIFNLVCAILGLFPSIFSFFRELKNVWEVDIRKKTLNNGFFSQLTLRNIIKFCSIPKLQKFRFVSYG